MSEQQTFSEASATIGELARRGGMDFTPADCALIRRVVRHDNVSWLGGMRQDSQGQITFIDAISSPVLTEEEARRVGQMIASIHTGFYDAATDGLPLTATSAVVEWYDASVADNYPEASETFLRFATTYWTFKVLLRSLELNESATLTRVLLRRLDELVAPLFFPYDGPLVANPNKREADQIRFLKTFAPRIDIKDFMRGNPILIRDRKRVKPRWRLW